MNKDYADTFKKLYADSDDRIYEVILGCTVEEIEEAIQILKKHIVHNYELIRFLESQKEYVKSLDRELADPNY